jgi:hypothetical protein
MNRFTGPLLCGVLSGLMSATCHPAYADSTALRYQGPPQLPPGCTDEIPDPQCPEGISFLWVTWGPGIGECYQRLSTRKCATIDIFNCIMVYSTKLPDADEDECASFGELFPYIDPRF